MKNLIFVSVLIALQVCSGFRLNSQNELEQDNVDARLMSIDSSSFGSILLDTVSIQLETGNVIEEIIKLLNDARGELVEAQNLADAKNKSDEESCVREIADYTAKIAEAQGKIDAANKKLEETLRPHLAEVQADIKATLKSMAENRAERVRLTKEREAAHAAFEGRVVDHNAAISAIDEARPEIEKLVNAPPTLIQVEAHARRITFVLTQLKDLKINDSMYGVLISTLTQVALRKNFSNQDIVKRILDLFKQIRAQLVISLASERANEAAEIVVYKKAMVDNQAEYDGFVAVLAEQREDEKATEEEIARQEEIVREQTAIRNTWQNDLRLKMLWCQEQRDIYFAETNKRDEEKVIIDEVVQIFTDMNAHMRDYLRRRVDKIEV